MTRQLFRDGASFRDPSGFVFYRERELFRQINLCYQKNYDYLISSGLYDELSQNGSLISHQEVTISPYDQTNCYKIIKPETVGFISYPYEWSFNQLKDAALLTLGVQQKALNHGMSLKDASAFNVQFHHGQPVMIDTLSFEQYQDGGPWIAYRQFCQHFLAPLALMAQKDVRLGRLLSCYLDGLPLALASRLLPFSSWLNSGLLAHLHLHAKAQSGFFQDRNKPNRKYKLSRQGLITLISSLEMTVKALKLNTSKSDWQGYYQNNNYSNEAMASKQSIVKEMIGEAKPRMAWDLGANTGEFSRICASRGINTVAFDGDHDCVDSLYRTNKQAGVKNLLPLIIDLNNPTPALGWHNQERMSLMARGPVDLVLALALIHHLAIANNIPLSQIAELFREITNWLIIEFVPKDDSQVKGMLINRADVFVDYNAHNFETQFQRYFKIERKIELIGSSRSLYLMKKSAVL